MLRSASVLLVLSRLPAGRVTCSIRALSVAAHDERHLRHHRQRHGDHEHEADALRPVVVAGPSGSGKSTLIRKLVEEFPKAFGFCVSHTSRAPRPGETHGSSYYYATRSDMEAMQARGEFFETAVYNNNLYGTSLAALKNVIDSGRVPVLDIDMQGVLSIKRVMIAQAQAKLQGGVDSATAVTNVPRDFPDLQPKFILVVPPGVEELEARLRKRGEPEEGVQLRVAQAKNEFLVARWPGLSLFEVTVENVMVSLAYPTFRSHVLAANPDYNHYRS